MFLCFSNGSIHSLKHRSVLPSIWISFDQLWGFYIFQFKHSRWYPIAFTTLFLILRVWSCVYLCVIHTENIYFIFTISLFFFKNLILNHSLSYSGVYMLLFFMLLLLQLFTYLHNLSFICFFARQPPGGQGLLIHEVSRSNTMTHHSRQDSSGRVISSSQSPLRDNTPNTHNRQTSMPPVGFEPTISAGERPQTYALDRAATETGAGPKYIVVQIWPGLICV